MNEYDTVLVMTVHLRENSDAGSRDEPVGRTERNERANDRMESERETKASVRETESRQYGDSTASQHNEPTEETNPRCFD